jgi:hypothetical protein
MVLFGVIRKAELALVLALALTHLFALAQPAYTVMGGWFPATSNQHTERVLEQALQEASELSGAAGGHLCFRQIDAIQQQLVNGINFRYHMKGCVLPDGQSAGRCPSTDCENAQFFQVDVFCQPWTNTARVLNAVRV